jgi:hypothetical protein
MQGVRTDESGLAVRRAVIAAMAQRDGVEVGGCGHGIGGFGASATGGQIETLVLHPTG